MTAEERRAIVRRSKQEARLEYEAQRRAYAETIDRQGVAISSLEKELEAAKFDLEQACEDALDIKREWREKALKAESELADYQLAHWRSILQQLKQSADTKTGIVFSSFAAQCMVDHFKRLVDEN